MKKIYCLFILLGLFLTGNVPTAESRDDGIFRIGVSSSVFDEINQNDAAAALKAWAATVGREQNFDGLLDVVLLTSTVEELRSELDAKRLDGLSITVAEYLDLNIQVEQTYIPVTEQGPEVSYAIIVGKDAEMPNVENLAKSRLVMGKSGRMNLARPWLQSFIAERAGGFEMASNIDLMGVENPSKAILQVFFNQADGALVVEEAFDLACELNPQLRERLKVLATSPKFVISFFIFPPGKNGERNTEKLEKAIRDLHTTPGGRQVLNVFKSNRVAKYPVSVLENTIQFLENYQSQMNGDSIPEIRP